MVPFQEPEDPDYDGPDLKENAVEENTAVPADGEEKGNADEEDKNTMKNDDNPAGGREHSTEDKMVKKYNLCKFWRNGACKSGDWCGFAHGKEEIGKWVPDPQFVKVELCKHFVKGNCRDQVTGACAFAHGVQEMGSKKPEQKAGKPKEPLKTTQHRTLSRGQGTATLRLRSKTSVDRWSDHGSKRSRSRSRRRGRSHSHEAKFILQISRPQQDLISEIAMQGENSNQFSQVGQLLALQDKNELFSGEPEAGPSGKSQF